MAGRTGQISQSVVRRGDIFMCEDVDFGAREATAIDDAGVVQLVGNDVVAGTEDRGNGSRVGRKAGLKHHACLYVFERRNAFLELDVEPHRAGNRSYGARADAEFPHRLERRLA